MAYWTDDILLWANPTKSVRTLADPRFIAARRALEAGDLHRAGPMLDALLAEDESEPVMLALRAEVDVRERRFREAIARFEQSLVIAPGHLAALHGQAYCHYQMGRLAQARNLVDRMLWLDPVNMPARLLKAAVAGVSGDNADAALLYRGVLAEQPNHYPSLLGLGHSLRILKRMQGLLVLLSSAALAARDLHTVS